MEFRRVLFRSAFPGFTPDQLPSLMQHLVADHLTGEQLGEIAAEPEVKKVILTHFSPGSDGETNLDSYAAGISRSFRGDAIPALERDDFCFPRRVDIRDDRCVGEWLARAS